MSRRFYRAAVLIAVGFALLIVAAFPASAADCSTNSAAGWYVNPDETALQPTWTADGLVLDGPSLIHHAVTGTLLLADLTPGTFTQTGLSGVLPLIKFETSGPYSTINQTTSGTDSFWSSKLPADADGGQDHPEPIAVLAALSPYTPTTTVATFGIGYATDPGNRDTVTSIRFAGVTHSFVACPTSAPTTGGPTSGTGSGSGSTGSTGGTSHPTTAPHPQVAANAGQPSTDAAILPVPSDITDSTDTTLPEYTPEPSQSTMPIVQLGATATPGQSHTNWLVVGGGTLLGLVLVGGLFTALVGGARKRRDAQPAAATGPVTQYAPGVAGTEPPSQPDTMTLPIVGDGPKHAEEKP